MEKRTGHSWTLITRVWALWTPQDLNLEPSDLRNTAGPHLGPPELSEHRGTSTWNPPEYLPDKIPKIFVRKFTRTISENIPGKCQKMYQIKWQKIYQTKCQKKNQ